MKVELAHSILKQGIFLVASPAGHEKPLHVREDMLTLIKTSPAHETSVRNTARKVNVRIISVNEELRQETW